MKFIVYLTKYSENKLPRWYIGSSSKDRIDKGYTGSVTSKKWADIYYSEKEKNSDLFKTRILSHHKTRDEAVAEEYRLQKMHNVVKSNKYFNEAFAAKNGCFTRDKFGILNPMYGKGELLSGNKNGRHRDNFKGNMEEVSKNISNSLKKTDKNKKGNNPASKKYYINDIINNKHIDIPKGHLYEFCEKYNLSYSGLQATIHSKKPIKLTHRTKYKNSVGMQLFEGTYNES